MIEIKIYEMSGLPATAEARSKVVEDCFATSTFHVEVPEKNRYFVARVTRVTPPPGWIQKDDEGVDVAVTPSVRQLKDGEDDVMIERVFQVMTAMGGAVGARVINAKTAAEAAAAPRETVKVGEARGEAGHP